MLAGKPLLDPITAYLEVFVKKTIAFHMKFQLILFLLAFFVSKTFTGVSMHAEY